MNKILFMKYKGVILFVLLVFVLMTSITAISAQNATDNLTADADNVLEENTDDIEEISADENIDIVQKEDNVLNDTLASNEDNATVFFTTYKNKAHWHNIFLTAKAETNKGKVGEKILYTIKVTNKNLFDVYMLDLYMGEYQEYTHSPISTGKGYGIYDDSWVTVNKLGAGQTKTIKMYLVLWEPSNTTIETDIGDYESKSKIRTIANTPKVTKKAVKTKITYKANGKAVKKLKVEVKVYTGKYYKLYKLKTNKKGIIKFKTKYLTKGKHKIVFKSLNKKYSLKNTFKIRI